MIESIIQSTKIELGKELSKNGVKSNQMDDVLGVAQDTILKKFKSSATGGDLDGILNLFNGKQSITGSPLVKSVINDYAFQLISKLGFSKSMSKTVANTVIPFIMNLINKKTPDTGLNNNDLISMLGSSAFTGGKNSVLGKLKNLF